MPEARANESLQEADDLGFHRRQWRFERIGWVGLLVFIALSALGLFGSGPLSRRTAGSGQLSVEYERFARRQAPAELVFRSFAASAGKLQFWIAQDYIEQVGVEHITPSPERTELRGGKVHYTFAASPGEELRVTFDLQPQQVGLQRARAGVAGGAEFSYWQFIYP